MTRTHLFLDFKLDFSVHTKESKETKMASGSTVSFMSVSNHQLSSLVHYGHYVSVRIGVYEMDSMETAYIRLPTG